MRSEGNQLPCTEFSFRASHASNGDIAITAQRHSVVAPATSKWQALSEVEPYSPVFTIVPFSLVQLSCAQLIRALCVICAKLSLKFSQNICCICRKAMCYGNFVQHSCTRTPLNHTCKTFLGQIVAINRPKIIKGSWEAIFRVMDK